MVNPHAYEPVSKDCS